jgi:signal transduction histidine kinase
MEVVIFRIVQECLTNTHRHSGSKTARIVVARKGENVYVEVQDHGKGMSRERFAEVQSHGTGVGLRGMRERAHQLHGDFSIESNSLGTKISATFPAKTLPANEESTTQRRCVA